MLEMSEAQVRAFANSGALDVARGPRGELQFSFQDLVLLRTAKDLTRSKFTPRKIRRALENLRDQLPQGRPLSAVRITSMGDEIVVQDGDAMWEPESGQALIDFHVADIVERAEPATREAAARARQDEDEMTAEDWFEFGIDLEAASPDDARDAYRRAVELDPRHADAHVNLGRLLHEKGETRAAESHYRVALDIDPRHPTAAFNLGVVLDDMKRDQDAIAAYRKAIEIDTDNADAHYNLAGVYERAGRKAAAIRHLKAYKDLVS
jgi:tetratricopeptide (TPR) repeat protein